MIERYLESLTKVRNLSQNSVRAYRQDLTDFARWASVRGLRWSNVTKEDAASWEMAMHDKGEKPATICRRVSALRSFYRWMVGQGWLQNNPIQYVQSPKKGETLPRVIDLEAISRFLANPSRTRSGAMMQAMVALMTATGIRLQEALDLRREDFDRKERSIRIKGKGNKERKVYYSQTTAIYLSAYAGKRKGYIFEVRDQREVRRMMSETLGAYSGRVHPHMLRHTFATAMLNNGCDIKSLSQILGHESVKTTERYARVAQANLAEAMRSKSPLN